MSRRKDVSDLCRKPVGYGLVVVTCLYMASCTSGSSGHSSDGLPSSSGGAPSGAGGSTAGQNMTPVTTGGTGGAGGTGNTAGTSGNSGAAGGGTSPTAGGGASGPGASTGGMAGNSGGGTASGGDASTPASDGGGQPPVSAGAANVLQYHNNAQRTGMYVDAALTRAAAATLHKDPSFHATIAGPTYAQPLYFEGGPGGRDLVITATEQNEVTAFSAADASIVWRTTLAKPVSSGLPCGNIRPLGVTGTPMIDAASRTLYVAAMTSGPKHQVFALSLEDGSTKPGFPVDVSGVRAGTLAFKSSDQNQRGSLLIVNKMLYVPYGGHFGDCGQYHGWVVGIPLDASSPPIAFATRAHAAGIWAPGGLASDGTSVFATTGNSMSDEGGIYTTPPTWGHGNAILRLGPDLKTITESDTKDYFTPQNWADLDRRDLDLGGCGPLLFTVPGAKPSELVLALGKNGGAYLLSRDNLGGKGGMLDMTMVAAGGPLGGMINAATAYTTPSGTFVAFRTVQTVSGCASGSGFLGALKIDGSQTPPKMNVAWCAGADSTASPISTTTDGTHESIVWYMANGKLFGFNGESGAPVYTGGGANDGIGYPNKFQTPIVAKGRIFIASENNLLAFTP